MKIEMYLLGYTYESMVSHLIDCLENDRYSWTVVKNFAKRYDAEYNLKVLKRLEEWRNKHD